MRWPPPSPVLLVIALTAMPGSCAAIIDRVAVSVGNSAITESELERQLRITAFLNRQKAEFTPEAKRRVANRLVEQKLVKRELELSRYAFPSEADVKPLLDEVKSNYVDEAAFQKALTAYGITVEDLKRQLHWQLTLLRFIEVRFRPGIEVNEQEIRDYFEREIQQAALKENPGHSVSLQEHRERIEEILTAQKVDQSLDAWLKTARVQANVKFREEAFR
jgi:hypothetical protein